MASKKIAPKGGAKKGVAGKYGPKKDNPSDSKATEAAERKRGIKT